MRIGSITSATLLTPDLEAVLGEWPSAKRGILPRERALAIGALALAEAPCAVVGDARALTIVECPRERCEGRWMEVRCDEHGRPMIASVVCERPRQAFGWYRGLGMQGRAVERADGGIKVELPGGQALKLLPPGAAHETTLRPWLVSFSRVDAQGQHIAELSPRILAGPAGEVIEIV